MRSAIIHLQCSRSACGRTADQNTPRNLCPNCGSPLLARYDLSQARRTLTLSELASRPRTMWRYAEVLPAATPVTLGEGMTPLIHAVRLGSHLGLHQLYVKDEGQNPTGSFKARGLSAALSVARALGIETVALPTAGNAGGAAAAYAARSGLNCVVAMPADTPVSNVIEARAFGADVRLIDGLISDCGAFIADHAAREGWFELSTLKEPYRVEGKKTMGYELWEEWRGDLPDVIVYPTGGGVGLIGMWKAFGELGEMGLIGRSRPRMISVQAEGCAPIVQAFQKHADSAEFWNNAATVAAGLRVPKALGDFLVLRDLYASLGEAVAVSDDELMAACRDMARLEGVFAAPEGGAGLAAVRRLAAEGKIEPDERVVLFNTGTGYKYAEAWQAAMSP